MPAPQFQPRYLGAESTQGGYSGWYNEYLQTQSRAVQQSEHIPHVATVDPAPPAQPGRDPIVEVEGVAHAPAPVPLMQDVVYQNT